MRGSQKNREPRLAVRAVKGTVFSTAATGQRTEDRGQGTGRGQGDNGQDKTRHRQLKRETLLQGYSTVVRAEKLQQGHD